MGFSRQQYWSELLCPSPGHLPDSGIKPRCPALQAASLPSELPGKPNSRLAMWLLLLLSHFSRVRLCATTEMAAHQAPPTAYIWIFFFFSEPSLTVSTFGLDCLSHNSGPRVRIAQGISLVVQCLRLGASNAGGLVSIPGEETRSHIPQLRVHMLQ